MKVNTTELSGAGLGWAVAKCEVRSAKVRESSLMIPVIRGSVLAGRAVPRYAAPPPCRCEALQGGAMNRTLMVDPYTGTPRHPSDIASDPEGFLIVEDIAAPILAAAQAPTQRKAAERAAAREISASGGGVQHG